MMTGGVAQRVLAIVGGRQTHHNVSTRDVRSVVQWGPGPDNLSEVSDALFI